jgi:hypothetical protein
MVVVAVVVAVVVGVAVGVAVVVGVAVGVVVVVAVVVGVGVGVGVAVVVVVVVGVGVAVIKLRKTHDSTLLIRRPWISRRRPRTARDAARLRTDAAIRWRVADAGRDQGRDPRGDERGGHQCETPGLEEGQTRRASRGQEADCGRTLSISVGDLTGRPGWVLT